MTPFWSHQTQSIVFRPKRCGLVVDVGGSPGAKYIHFSSPVTIRWRNDFLLYLASSISQVVFRFSCCLSFGSCGTHFPTFWIFPMAFKRMETASRVTFNWSASCYCVWASSSSNNACNSLSWNFFGGLPRSSFPTLKLPLLNFLNHSKHCDLPRACSP